MAIEKMMTPNEVELLGEGPDLEVEVMADADSAVEVEMDDGSVVINFGSPDLMMTLARLWQITMRT